MILVQHYDFASALGRQLEIAGSDEVQVALRAGGGLKNANICITHSNNTRLTWRVGPNAGSVRSDSWNMYGWIKKALGITQEFPDAIYNVYEKALNTTKQGWVVLIIRGGRAISAEHRPKL